MRRAGRVTVVVATMATASVLGSAVAAAAAWVGSRAMTQSVATGAFQAPTDLTVAATPGTNRVTVSWRASSFSGDRPVGYTVLRHAATATSPSDAGTVACGLAAAHVPAGSAVGCDDITGTPGTTYRYSVRPRVSSWTGPAQGLSTTKTFPVATDTTAPTITKIELLNGGGTPGEGYLRQGDALRLTFSEAMSPNSLCSGFSNSNSISGSNDVRITVSPTDVLTVTAKSCSNLALGSITLPGNYNDSSNPLVYEHSGNNVSKLTYDPVARTLTVDFGKSVTGNNAGVENGTYVDAGTLAWVANGTVGRDLAGNPVSTTTWSQAGQRF